jgi:hypothetical protein
MFSNLFALSALLGFMAALPVKSANIQVTVGGPGGVVAYNPSNVVGSCTIFSCELLDQRIL